MASRYRARVLITVVTMLIAFAVTFLTVMAVRTSLAGVAPHVLDDASAAGWTLAPLLIAFAGVAAWVLSGHVSVSLANLRRDVALNARTRALATPQAGEPEEVHALRETLLHVFQELEADVRVSQQDIRRVFTMLEDISEGIMHIAADGRFVHVNRAARRLLALPNQAEGQQAAALIRNHELRETIEKALLGENIVPAEITFDNRHLLVAPQSLHGTGNGGAVISVVDLTEIRRLEAVRRDFVANVSHELKTPLTSIRGYTETLLADDVDRATQLEFLEIVRKNAARLQRIVDELLDLSRLQSGGWTPDLEEVDIMALSKEIWSECALAAESKQIEFSIAGESANVLADAAGLRQVLGNIFENAIRYTPAGGRVDVAITATGSEVAVAVSDNGIGIPAASLPRIFERFYRVDPARSRAAGGTGLGLAIVKHLMEQMNGSVAASSVLGSGTTMTIRLPRYLHG